jgi:hypothetical protein
MDCKWRLLGIRKVKVSRSPRKWGYSNWNSVGFQLDLINIVYAVEL